MIETFGHTKDGICLLDSENRLLFSGDSVVSTPTLITEPCKSDTMEHYAKALKHLEGREAEFDLIFPGHYVHPIPKTYLKELIVCAEKIWRIRCMAHRRKITCQIKSHIVHFIKRHPFFIQWIA